jgi:hypothetical protein
MGELASKIGEEGFLDCIPYVKLEIRNWKLSIQHPASSIIFSLADQIFV